MSSPEALAELRELLRREIERRVDTSLPIKPWVASVCRSGSPSRHKRERNGLGAAELPAQTVAGDTRTWSDNIRCGYLRAVSHGVGNGRLNISTVTASLEY
jgi:hypothetical protein